MFQPAEITRHKIAPWGRIRPRWRPLV